VKKKTTHTHSQRTGGETKQKCQVSTRKTHTLTHKERVEKLKQKTNKKKQNKKTIKTILS
jgi:hypothetical protein